MLLVCFRNPSVGSCSTPGARPTSAWPSFRICHTNMDPPTEGKLQSIEETALCLVTYCENTAQLQVPDRLSDILRSIAHHRMVVLEGTHHNTEAVVQSHAESWSHAARKICFKDLQTAWKKNDNWLPAPHVVTCSVKNHVDTCVFCISLYRWF